MLPAKHASAQQPGEPPCAAVFGKRSYPCPATNLTSVCASSAPLHTYSGNGTVVPCSTYNKTVRRKNTQIVVAALEGPKHESCRKAGSDIGRSSARRHQ
mmetsp:Transcript_51063/g.136196  ORF Transcript_51063/g.136196 Transcript_51063/m.136196 type:complete len:99 (-) Transcript_51063:1496-1792(-)